VAEPTGVTTPSVEDDAEFAEFADDEYGADVPSEYTTETAQDAPARAAARRPVVTGHAGGTGRRKEAIARVRILPGSGQWTINGRTLDVYFPNKVHQQLVNEPFVTLGAESQFDVVALISGGGVTGQAGDQGRPGQGAQEVRPEEGPEGSAVLQAVRVPLRTCRAHERERNG
jgi:small subunit ribosomal protein S9